MPRILRIHNRLVIGGPTIGVLNLAKYLEPDFETLVVVGLKESHEKDASHLAKEKGISPVVITEMERSINLLKDYKSFSRLNSIIKDFKPDIVHTHAAKPGVLGRLAASIMHVPLIIHTYEGHVFHSYFGKLKTQLFLQIERAMGRRSDALIAISPEQKRELAEQYKIAPADKFHIVPLGFELQRFRDGYEEKRKFFREEFNVNDDEIAIGIIGRLVPVKNHQLFLEGIAAVLRESNKKIKAFIIGDGETRQLLEHYVGELKIPFNAVGEKYDSQKVITFTSWRTDVDVINAGLDIICLTSLNEGTPVSLIEAQAAGKPIVSTRVGGIGDVVIDNETALLSDVNDKQSFVENLYKLLEDDNLRQRMAEKGPSFVMDRFSVQRLANDFRNLYYELLNQKRR